MHSFRGLRRFQLVWLYRCAVLVLCFPAFVLAAENENRVETVGEVSIIGNTELPNVTFNLPWRLPSIENREEQSPPKELPGMLAPIEPKRHQQQVYFHRFLELDVSGFSKR